MSVSVKNSADHLPVLRLNCLMNSLAFSGSGVLSVKGKYYCCLLKIINGLS